MTIDVRASGDDLELWHVQLGGAVRTMTLDELDHAFQSGVIDEHTMVLKAGALHWTTLGAVAGLDEQPNSIAPMATDIAASTLVMPALPTPRFDVSFGTEELRVFRPKRRIGRLLAAAAVAALVFGGAFGVKTYGLDALQARAASLAELVKGQSSESARSATGLSAPIAEPTEAPAAAPPPTPVESLPSATAATPGVSIDALPSAPPEKATKKHKKHGGEPKRKASSSKAKSKASSDPTQRGSGPFDPLNGSL